MLSNRARRLKSDMVVLKGDWENEALNVVEFATHRIGPAPLNCPAAIPRAAQAKVVHARITHGYRTA